MRIKKVNFFSQFFATCYLPQGCRNGYNVIDHGHKKKYFYVFFQRPINFGVSN